MQILNALDAISPAFARTKLVLFTPFRKGRTWKLAMTAYLSLLGMLFFPFPLMYLAIVPLLHREVGHTAAMIAVAIITLLTVIYVVVFVLCSRLEFAFFDIVLNRGEFVAPAWRKYGDAARQWTLVKVVVGVLIAAALAAPSVPLARAVSAYFMILPEMMKSIQPGQPPPAQMVGFMAGLYALYFCVLLVAGLYFLLMSTASSFMLPSMALEGMRPATALRRLWAFIQREPGAFFAFVGLRAALGIAGYIGLVLAYEVVLLLSALVVVGVCALLGLLLHLLHVPMFVLMFLAIVAGIAFVVVMYGYVFFMAVGTYLTFFEAHTLYFLGGRYPMLGELLERSTPPPVVYAPPGYSPYAPPPQD